MNEEVREAIKEQIAVSIKESVNGKIDAMRAELYQHNQLHEADMRELKPIIEAYGIAKTSGWFFMKIVGIITAIGTLGLLVKQLIWN